MLLPSSDSHSGRGLGSPSGEAATLREVVAALREQIDALLEQNRSQGDVIAAQATRIAELERRLGLNSTNSGKPRPAMD